MIGQLRNLADELRREADELDQPEVEYDTDDPAGELNEGLASDRREIASRLELVLKTAIMDEYDKQPLAEAVRVDGLSAFDFGDYVVLMSRPTTTLDIEDACKLRDFLIAALAKHEIENGL